MGVNPRARKPFHRSNCGVFSFKNVHFIKFIKLYQIQKIKFPQITRFSFYEIKIYCTEMFSVNIVSKICTCRNKCKMECLVYEIISRVALKFLINNKSRGKGYKTQRITVGQFVTSRRVTRKEESDRRRPEWKNVAASCWCLGIDF